MTRFLTCFTLFICLSFCGIAQTIPSPTIIDVVEDDHMATVYWNSKTYPYETDYDPDKQAGVFSYLIEWGKQSDGYTHSQVTPYRVHQIQAIDLGETYMARVYNLDVHGNKSAPSVAVTFQTDDTRVTEMAARLNGGFDDMNLPMGPFDETKWNQAYSGCIGLGKVSQHINDQFHGHNVIASGDCDRGIACSRFRDRFDFTNRTGNIEFDLDGSKRSRQLWYLDIMPADRIRDMNGHTDLISSNPGLESDPAFLLRFVEMGNSVMLQIADADGVKHIVPDIYQNSACGDDMRWCPGENLTPLTNVRRHWKIALSKTHIQVFINDILIIDGSLITEWTPNGLPYEEAYINWLFFSYNTTKENFLLSMVHWDNFGIDAPTGYEASTVTHNYTDGNLGTSVAPIGNEASAGMAPTVGNPAVTDIPIPDQINDLQGNDPLSAKLYFTMQGGTYSWSSSDQILVNGISYPFAEPLSSITGLPATELINSLKPYSARVILDPSDLTNGSNQIAFDLPGARILNVHIELTFPIYDAPTYSPPITVHADHMTKLMAFQSTVNQVGPGMVINELNDDWLGSSDYQEVLDQNSGHLQGFVKISSVCGNLSLRVEGNSDAQLAASGKAKGISYYEILVDQNVIDTYQVDTEQAVAYFEQDITLNLTQFSDGEHELFIRAYDVDGRISQWDSFQAHALPGDYIPIVFTINNSDLSNCPTWATCPEDVNLDGVVNIDDFLALNSTFGDLCACPEDINQDGVVNIDDFLLMNSAFGQPCP